VRPLERPALGPFIALPPYLPVAPRPLAGELLSSWLGRLAAANALSFEELLEALRVRLAPSRAASFYPGRLDYGCSRPLTQALATLSRWPAERIAALDLKRRFGALGLRWLNHDVSPFSHAKHRAQVLPSYCAECLREQTLRGEPAHLRAEWALAFLTHCPQHRGLLQFCCPDCRELDTMGWALGRGQPPTSGCRRCALRPEIVFLEAAQPWSRRQDQVLGLEAALLAAVPGEQAGPRAPNPHWVGVVKPADFVRLVGDLLDILGWPDAREGLLLLQHLQRGSCRVLEPGGRPLPAEAEAFGSLGRREQLERLVGVVDLLGAGARPEGQARDDANPFCCVYGPMSVAGRREFLRRQQRWPEPVRLKALKAAACFSGHLPRSGRKGLAIGAVASEIKRPWLA
jgi:hypothetical protein